MLRFVFRKGLASVVLAVLCIGAGQLVAGWTQHETHTPAPRASASDSVSRPRTLLARHDCWTGRAPRDMQGKVPGHVVVTTRSGKVKYGGDRLVVRALNQLFAHQRAGLTVWGFCR